MPVKKRAHCKDCPVPPAGGRGARPAPYPGPRCATHHRERRRAVRDAAHAQHVARTFGVPHGGYGALRDAQQGLCAICRRATGARRRLAVDHDHRTGEVRGLLCSPCNRLLGHLRDDPVALIRAALYLINPPARAVLVYDVHMPEGGESG